MKKNNLNEIYSVYKENSTEENFDFLGEALIQYIRALIAIKYRSQVDVFEDAVGEASVKVLSQLESFDSTKSPFPVWVKIIVDNTCLDLLRSKTHKGEETYVDEVVHTSNRDREAFIQLNQLMIHLTPKERQFVGYKLDGLTEEEVGKNFGISQQAANFRWRKIMEKLRTHAGGKG